GSARSVGDRGDRARHGFAAWFRSDRDEPTGDVRTADAIRGVRPNRRVAGTTTRDDHPARPKAPSDLPAATRSIGYRREPDYRCPPGSARDRERRDARKLRRGLPPIQWAEARVPPLRRSTRAMWRIVGSHACAPPGEISGHNP